MHRFRDIRYWGLDMIRYWLGKDCRWKHYCVFILNLKFDIWQICHACMPYIADDQQTWLGMFFSSFSLLCFGGCLLVQCLATFCWTELGGEASLLLANQKFANRPLLPLDLQDILPLPPSQSYFFAGPSHFQDRNEKCSEACQKLS